MGAQAAAPMDVSLEMARERQRSRRAWALGEEGEERRVKGEVVEAMVEGLLWEVAAWVVAGVGGEGEGEGEMVN